MCVAQYTVNPRQLDLCSLNILAHDRFSKFVTSFIAKYVSHLLKTPQLQGGFAPLTPWPGALPLDPTGGKAPRPPCSLALRPRSTYVPPLLKSCRRPCRRLRRIDPRASGARCPPHFFRPGDAPAHTRKLCTWNKYACNLEWPILMCLQARSCCVLWKKNASIVQSPCLAKCSSKLSKK